MVNGLKEKVFDVYAPSSKVIHLNGGMVSLDLMVRETASIHLVHLTNARVYTTSGPVN